MKSIICLLIDFGFITGVQLNINYIYRYLIYDIVFVACAMRYLCGVYTPEMLFFET